MRTTVTLDDDNALRLQAIAHQRRKPFKAVINEVIRMGLGMLDKPVKRKRFKVVPHPSRLRPGFDPARFNQLLDELAAEEFIRKMARSR
jgi:hypothetical protein